MPTHVIKTSELKHVQPSLCKLQRCPHALPSNDPVLSPFLQGTVIRVFSVPQGEKLVEFRRGMKR